MHHFKIRTLIMTPFNLNEMEQQLNAVNMKKQQTGVSFSGKALKLNKEEDASEVIEEILKCEKLEYLDLEGNTLGPDAAEAISKALSQKGEDLKRALWKDMFTGRMKDEIPLALEYLGQGLCLANTRLVELDLSDNAFGPIGVKGLASLLTSSSCYTLQKLRLNNNGLGISGGKMLAQALLDCNTKSLEETKKPLALKVFIAGRNRLENDGAKALAQVFQTLKTLEEVVMPQNGIYHVGIASLATALSSNFGLRVLNLNDNTVGVKGANALAKALPSLSNLERLNLGDCLLKTKGAQVITNALIEGDYPTLMELNLSFNEIQKHAINSITEAVENKSLLSILALDGNHFGRDGCEELRSQLIKFKRINCLGTLEEDGSDDDDEYEDDQDYTLEDYEEEEEDEEGEEEEELEDEDDHETEGNESVVEIIESKNKSITVIDFMKNPIGNNLLLLQGNRAQILIEFIKNISGTNDRQFSEELSKTIMKVSALCGSGYMDVRAEAEKVTDLLYAELFKHAKATKETSVINNTLLINLGLLKAEDKFRNKIDWNLEYCFKALEKIIQQNYFPQETKDMLKLFIEKQSLAKNRDMDSLIEAKNSLKAALDKQ